MKVYLHQGTLIEGEGPVLALTSLDQHIFILKPLITFVRKQATVMRRSSVLSLPLQLVFLAFVYRLLALSQPRKPVMELTFGAYQSEAPHCTRVDLAPTQTLD
jgi:hypothetical protein